MTFSFLRNLFRPKCPYCRFIFDVYPRRSAACPSCGKQFFVLKGKLITENEKMVADLTKFTGHYGSNRRMIDEAIAKFGMNFGNCHHSILQQCLLKAKSANDFDMTSSIYRSLSEMNKDERMAELSEIYADLSLESELRKIDGKRPMSQDQINNFVRKRTKDISRNVV
jgi:hypothetical protein